MSGALPSFAELKIRGAAAMAASHGIIRLLRENFALRSDVQQRLVRNPDRDVVEDLAETANPDSDLSASAEQTQIFT